jgi:hypothetical protein
MYWRVENGGALLIAMAFIKANNFKLKFIARCVYTVRDILSNFNNNSACKFKGIYKRVTKS